MLRIYRSLAAVVVAGAISPLVASAAPFAKVLNAQPSIKTAKSDKVTFTLINRSDVTRAVTVDGHTYTLNPHQQLSISAASGSPVTETASEGSAKVLFTVDRMHKGATVSLN